MCAAHNDADYASDFDQLIGAVESLGDSRAASQWGTGNMGEVIGPDHLPTHAPCLTAFRLLKKCMRASRTAMKPCLHELKDLENCSAAYFYEMNLKLPKEACEPQKEAYFSIEIGGPQTFKEAKQAWLDLYNCSKTVEHELNLTADFKRPRL